MTPDSGDLIAGDPSRGPYVGGLSFCVKKGVAFFCSRKQVCISLWLCFQQPNLKPLGPPLSSVQRSNRRQPARSTIQGEKCVKGTLHFTGESYRPIALSAMSYTVR